MSKSKLPVVIILVVAALVIILLGVFWQKGAKEEAKGALTNVDKADRNQGKQLTREEILQENQELNNVVQSAEFQNIMNDEELKSLFFSKEFQTLLEINHQSTNLYLFVEKFIAFAANQDNWVNKELSVEKVIIFLKSEEMQIIILDRDVDVQKLVMSQEMKNILANENLKIGKSDKGLVIDIMAAGLLHLSESFSKLKFLLAQDNLNVVVMKLDLLLNTPEEINKRLLLTKDLQNMFLEKGLQGLSEEKIQALSEIFWEDKIQILVASYDVCKVIMSQDFQFLYSNEFDKFL